MVAGQGDMEAAAPFERARFDTTRWSVISAARDLRSSVAAEALEILCRAYWYPLYAYVRRKGLAPEDAQDVTQEFFHRLIEKESLKAVDRRQGNFRSFLLASMNHLLCNEWDRARRLKRGGGYQIISLNAEEAEGRFVEDATLSDSPERIFDRRWTLTILDRAFASLRKEFEAQGKIAQFDAFKRFLSEAAGEGEYQALAEEMGLEEGNVAVTVHRLRTRYREMVRAEIAQTVNSEADLRAEMRHLYASLD